MKPAARRRWLGLASALALMLWTGQSCAHPLGNNTVNRQAALHVEGNTLKIDYLLDFAEIPTLAAAQDADADADGQTDKREWRVWVEQHLRRAAQAIRVSANGQTLPLRVGPPRWSLTDGAAGLSVLRASVRFSAPLPPGSRLDLAYEDTSFPHQRGWKEVWIAAHGTTRIASTDAARADRSQGLTRFDLDPGAAMPERISARASLEMPVPPTSEPLSSQPGMRDPAAQTATLATARDDTAPAAETLMAAEQAAPTGNPQPASPPGQDRWAQAGAFFRLGVHHIATGWDHLAFLLGLLLLQSGIRPLVKIVTAFTVAHSTTLALAANGWITPPSGLIEAAIALTIAYVGLVNLLRRGTAHGIWLAFGFGLVHGFGFAGALSESLADLPTGGAPWLLDLAAFNLGIEAFQVLLVCATAPLLAYVRERSWGMHTHTALSSLVLAAGLGWFASRSLSLA